jgi:hypothetical protein
MTPGYAAPAMRLRRVHERIPRGLEQVRPVALFEIAKHCERARAHVTTPAERRRLDELVAELPVRVGRAGVA